MKNKFTFPALIIVLAAMICGVGYYLISAAGEKEASLEEPHKEIKAEVEKEPTKEEPQVAMGQENEVVPDQQIPKPLAKALNEAANPQAPNPNN